MKQYYIIDNNGKQAGPYPGEQLRNYGITQDTYVWCDGMGQNWNKAGDVAELRPLFAPVQPAQPAQPTPGARPGGFGRPRPAQPDSNPTTPINPGAASQPQPNFGNPGPQQPQQPQQPSQPVRPSFGQPRPGNFGQPQQPRQPQQPQQPYGQQQPPYGQQPQQPYGQQPYEQPRKPSFGQPAGGYQAPRRPINDGFQNPSYAGPKPFNWLIIAILATILCCPPLGIVAIVYASKVDTLWNAGRYDESKDAANKAQMWSLISIGSSFLFSIIYFILIFANVW